MQDAPSLPPPLPAAHTSPPHSPECKARPPSPRPKSAIEECCAADPVFRLPPCSNRSNRRKPRAQPPELRKIQSRRLLPQRTRSRNSPTFLRYKKSPPPQCRG